MGDLKMSGRAVLKTLWLFLRFFVKIPWILLYHHLFPWSHFRKTIGRPWLPDFVVRFAQFWLSETGIVEARVIFNRDYGLSYKDPRWKNHRHLLQQTREPGLSGLWISDIPWTKLSDPEQDVQILYYIHGGGFVVDTAGSAQVFMLELWKEMNDKLANKNGSSSTKFAIFQLDYELSPEHRFPSPLLESIAGYYYLVNVLQIPPHKIVIAGDSAGGNLVAALLLWLARPNGVKSGGALGDGAGKAGWVQEEDRIDIPSELGEKPGKPGGVLLISPCVGLKSKRPSRLANEGYDAINDSSVGIAALAYVGTPLSGVPVHSRYKYPRAALPSSVPDTPSQAKIASNRFLSPFADPAVCNDLEWWKEALPDGEGTMVAWGGKEILVDDIEALMKTIKMSGKEVRKLCKPLAAHDWLLYDWPVHNGHITNGSAPFNDRLYGVRSVAAFLRSL